MGWDYRFCMHGRREGLDSHDCPECQSMALQLGWDCSGEKTYLFQSIPAELIALRERAEMSVELALGAQGDEAIRV